MLVGDRFRHEALLYAGADEFIGGTLPFVRAAVDGGEAILVVVDAPKIALLRDSLGSDAAAVQFADMTQVGHNPARIIPAWRDFIDEHSPDGRRLRGIGEPVWAGRSPVELVECRHHEALLNVAFADSDAFRLLCPYDVGSLDPVVVQQAHDAHASIRRDSLAWPGGLDGAVDTAALFAETLPEPPGPWVELTFGAEPLYVLRRHVEEQARAAGLGDHTAADLALAADELATNSLRHGGGRGSLRMWIEDGAVVCEVRDRGHITQPLVGRQRPRRDDVGGRGLWIVNQLCDLVQVRSSSRGTVVRLHVRPA